MCVFILRVCFYSFVFWRVPVVSIHKKWCCQGVCGNKFEHLTRKKVVILDRFKELISVSQNKILNVSEFHILLSFNHDRIGRSPTHTIDYSKVPTCKPSTLKLMKETSVLCFISNVWMMQPINQQKKVNKIENIKIHSTAQSHTSHSVQCPCCL